MKEEQEIGCKTEESILTSMQNSTCIPPPPKSASQTGVLKNPVTATRRISDHQQRGDEQP